MTLLSFSLSHRTAPVGARERAAQALGDVGSWLAGIRGVCSSIADVLVLSTCHRLEFYVVCSSEREAAGAIVTACGLPGSALRGGGGSGWIVRRDLEAAIHLCRVATGLDSVVVGEAEIAGQVRRAASSSRAAGLLGPRLEIILAGALTASGRARSETRIAQGVTSAASAGVVVAANHLGTLARRQVVVIGAGQAARTALGRIKRLAPARCAVVSRSRRHAESAAAIVAGQAYTLDQLETLLPEADLVVAATLADGFLLTLEVARRAFGEEPGRRRVLVDLSVPRVIDPRVGELDGVRVVTVDDLGDVARQSVSRRLREMPKVEAIAVEEARRSFQRFGARLRRSIEPVPRRA
jgi:glutamyl-tRNA reductase